VHYVAARAHSDLDGIQDAGSVHIRRLLLKKSAGSGLQCIWTRYATRKSGNFKPNRVANSIQLDLWDLIGDFSNSIVNSAPEADSGDPAGTGTSKATRTFASGDFSCTQG
jgi:hypothetical protein